MTLSESPVPNTRHGPGDDIATAASRTDRPNGVSAPASDKPDDVEHAQLRRADDVGRQIVERTRVAHAASSAESGILIEYLSRTMNLEPGTLEPGTTRVLADWLVAQRLDDIPDDVRHEALRSLVNIVGCAVGGSRHPAVDIALRALGPFSGPATAQPLARAERVDPLLASLVNGITSHVHDYDDTTPSNYSHPVVSRRVGAVRVREREPRQRTRFRARVHPWLRSRVAHRQRRVSGALRCRLAHHRNGRSVRRGRGDRKADRPVDAADDLGDRPGRDAGRRTARDVRVDGEGLPSRTFGAERLRSGAAGARRIHRRRAQPRGSARLCGRAGGQVRPVEDHQRARRRLGPSRQHLQAVSVRHRQPSDDRRLHPDSRRTSVRRRSRSQPCAFASRRW